MDNSIKTENWNSHEIRFIWHKEDWWAVANDVASALSYDSTGHMVRIIESCNQENVNPQKLNIIGLSALRIGSNVKILKLINEIGIYEAVFGSNKPEAKQFKQWVYSMLRELRQASGLEGFQIFRMLDKEHQKEAMHKLKDGLKKPVRVDFIKANTITNKAISNMTGSPKMIKKGDMTPRMLVQRQAILDDTIELMTVADKFNLDLSVSQKIYERYH